MASKEFRAPIFPRKIALSSGGGRQEAGRAATYRTGQRRASGRLDLARSRNADPAGEAAIIKNATPSRCTTTYQQRENLHVRPPLHHRHVGQRHILWFGLILAAIRALGAPQDGWYLGQRTQKDHTHSDFRVAVLLKLRFFHKLQSKAERPSLQLRRTLA
jgi:hypothetical protein